MNKLYLQYVKETGTKPLVRGYETQPYKDWKDRLMGIIVENKTLFDHVMGLQQE